jgi:hypothetical protein
VGYGDGGRRPAKLRAEGDGGTPATGGARDGVDEQRRRTGKRTSSEFLAMGRDGPGSPRPCGAEGGDGGSVL